MTSAQPGGSYEDRRETHGCSRHLAPPDHPRVYPLICARVENERVSRRPNDEANGARRDGARSARRSAAAAAAAGKKRRARKTKNPNVVHLAFAPAAASKPQTADLARMFRAKRGHECPYARRGDRFTREIAASPGARRVHTR